MGNISMPSYTGAANLVVFWQKVHPDDVKFAIDRNEIFTSTKA